MNNFSPKQLRDKNLDQPLKTEYIATTITQMLGFVGQMAVNGIQSDIELMIEKNKWRELDGYIFALSKIMKHDLAWACIEKSFANKKISVPPKYKPYFSNTQ